MINLLPPQEKQKIMADKKTNLVIVIGIVFTVSLMALALVMFMVNLYILQEVNVYENSLSDAQRGGQSKDLNALKSTLEKYNGLFAKLHAFYQGQVYASEALEAFLEIKMPSGISIDSLDVKVQQVPALANFTVSGFADTRDDLLELKNILAGDEKVRNPYFPPESWVKSEDINFFITFEVVK